MLVARLAGARISGADRELALLLADLAEQLYAAAGEVLKGDLALLVGVQLAHDLRHRVLHVQLPAHHQKVVPFERERGGSRRRRGG